MSAEPGDHSSVELQIPEQRPHVHVTATIDRRGTDRMGGMAAQVWQLVGIDWY